MQEFFSEQGKRFQKQLIATAKGRHGAKDMTREQAKEALSFIFSAEVHPVQIGAFLTATRFKRSTAEEMMGFLDAMEENATLIRPKVEGLLNCNGPYDGRKKALHMSLPSAIVAAAAGVPVVMHSNVGLPPKDGVSTAKVLDALGIPSSKEPELVEQDIEQKGFGHLHAMRYLHGVERLKPLRQILFYRSFLHACEVMLNPAGAEVMLIGAAHDTFLERFTEAPRGRGITRIMVVQGLDGGDELPLAPTPAVEYRDGEVTSMTIDPADYGLGHRKHHPCQPPAETARLIDAMLTGEETTHHDSLIFNAGVRIYLGGKAASIKDGVELARETVASGRAGGKLGELRG